MTLVEKAFHFGSKAHTGQVRKYTGEPYFVHPIEVSEIVKSVPHTEEMVAAALLHDVVEDTPVTHDQILAEFGGTVSFYVLMLTDVSRPGDGNRAARKAKDRAWIAAAPPAVKTIKLADLINNTESIVAHDKNFARVYLKEKLALLDVLTEGDPTLYARAKEMAVDGLKKVYGNV